MNVFAYGVMPLYPNGWTDGARVIPADRDHRPTPGFDGVALRCAPSCYLHYWVDHHLQYGERVMDTVDRPTDMGFCQRTGVEVTLRGPRDWSMRTTRMGGGE